jgi:hypothetical protein
MSDTVIAIVMHQMPCEECGIVFMAPLTLVNARTRTGEGIYCPNGHELFFDKPEPTKPSVSLEDRQRLVRAMHDAEQAEARAAEGKPPAPPAPAPCKREGDKIACTHCGKKYCYPSGIASHLHYEHRIEFKEEAVRELLNTTQAQTPTE